MRELQKLRMATKITRRELANRVGCAENYIYMLEAGGRNPSLPLAKRIAEEFGMPIESIFFTGKTNVPLDRETSA